MMINTILRYIRYKIRDHKVLLVTFCQICVTRFHLQLLTSSSLHTGVHASPHKLAADSREPEQIWMERPSCEVEQEHRIHCCYYGCRGCACLGHRVMTSEHQDLQLDHTEKIAVKHSPSLSLDVAMKPSIVHNCTFKI